MAQTPLTGTDPDHGLDPYCSAARFLQMYDWRTVGEFIADGEGRPTKADMVAVDIHGAPTTAVGQLLFALLMESSGDVDAACMVAKHYVPDDLAALLGNGKKYLERLVADLTIGKVLDRRPNPEIEPLPRVVAANKTLDNLRDGERIFGLQESAAAGNPETQFTSESDLATQNFASYQASRYFGQRSVRGRTSR